MSEKPLVYQLFDTLPEHQQEAVMFVKTFIDVYNSYDGAGLFTGKLRYQMLERRLRTLANRPMNMVSLWGRLVDKMAVDVPPTKALESITEVMTSDNPEAVMASLRSESVAIVGIAQQMHKHDKATAKAMRAMWDEQMAVADGATATNLDDLLAGQEDG